MREISTKKKNLGGRELWACSKKKRENFKGGSGTQFSYRKGTAPRPPKTIGDA